ncbi:MAG: SusC/RagA family TonB-linked outer membrane protein [Capnocytophaga sp.]|nr:SusC/RagA family TonB-linked outer membrane protein [Capnocytophaga sp.]
MKLRVFWAMMLFFVSLQMSFAQRISVSGTVKDDKGEPLIGVMVLVKGTNNGAITDIDGEYKLEANIGETLNFSFLGMKDENKKVTAQSSKINVTMYEDVQELEETVLVGYGTKKVASKTVASVAQISGKEIADNPNANVLDALQGRVAGMVISPGSRGDRPGSNSSQVVIHGLNSFSAAFQGGGVPSPLYIMDGIPVGSSVLTDLNSNDIESITVLKDAASTSIYGARAANGVILITTKKGRRNERTSISINHQMGFSAITSASRKFYDNLMSPTEYMDFWVRKNPSQVISAAGMTGSGEDTARAAAATLLQRYPNNTRWDNVFYKDFVPLYRTDVSISGGSNSTSYYLSLGYLDQDGTTPRTNYKRYTLNMNIDTQITSWLKGGVSVSLGHNDSQSSGGGQVGAYILSLPMLTPYNADGSRKNYIEGLTFRTNGFYHPDYLAEKFPSNSYGDDIIPIGYITIEPIKNLVFKSQAGVQYSISESERFQLASYTDYRTGGATTANAYRSMSKSISKTFNNTLEYRFNLGYKNHFNVLFGQESIENTYRSFNARSQGQPSDGLMMLTHGTRSLSVEDNKTIGTFNSLFGRLEYSHNSRYFLDLSARRDGSSVFGVDNRYGNFWAFGAMWKVKEETFLKNVKWLTDLNLRFSTGVSGSAGVGNYAHITRVASTNLYNQENGYVISTSGLGNPNLEWESQRKATLGLNFIINRSTSFNIEVYRRKTYGMLSTQDLNTTAGYSSYTSNVGDMQNQGLDFTFSSVVYRNKANDFTIRPYFNLNYNEAKITSFFLNSESNVNPSARMGYKLGRSWEWALPLYKGINPKTGRPEWYNPGTDKMEQQKDDSKVTTRYNAYLAQTTGKKRYAPVNGGFGLNVVYKDFTLDFGFSYSLGKYMMNLDREKIENPGNFGSTNLSKDLLNYTYWQQEGDQADYPSITSSTYLYADDRLLEDASFLRLKSISLSYRLPQQVIEQMKFFSGVRLYATARNIFTLTKYSGADPEYENPLSTGGYPPSRQFTIGVDLKF